MVLRNEKYRQFLKSERHCKVVVAVYKLKLMKRELKEKSTEIEYQCFFNTKCETASGMSWWERGSPHMWLVSHHSI